MNADGSGPGLTERLRRLAASVLQLGRTRLELAGLELQEELQRAAGLLATAVALLVCLLVALMLLAAAVLLWLTPEQRPLAAFVLAALAGAGAWWQWRRLSSALAQRPPLFEQTLAVLAADQAALQAQAKAEPKP
jgi:uncharacterized membrane protein YqjE